MKKDAGPALIGVAVVIIVAVIALLGYKFFGPKGKPVDNRDTNPAYQAYLKGNKQYPQQQRPNGSPGSGGSPNGSPDSGGASPGSGGAPAGSGGQ